MRLGRQRSRGHRAREGDPDVERDSHRPMGVRGCSEGEVCQGEDGPALGDPDAIQVAGAEAQGGASVPWADLNESNPDVRGEPVRRHSSPNRRWTRSDHRLIVAVPGAQAVPGLARALAWPRWSRPIALVREALSTRSSSITLSDPFSSAERDLGQPGNMRPMHLDHRIVAPTSPCACPPLLVLLHGIGTDEDDLLPLVPSLDPRFLVISARAPYPEPPGYRWYAIDWVMTPPSADPAEIASSRDLLASFVEEATSKHGIDPSCVFLLGFSQGAIMALALLLARPDLVRGVVAHSGRLARIAGGESRAEQLSRAEVLLLHGEEDPVVPVAEGRKAYQVLESLIGPRARFVEFPGLGHMISRASIGEAARWLTARIDKAEQRS